MIIKVQKCNICLVLSFLTNLLFFLPLQTDPPYDVLNILVLQKIRNYIILNFCAFIVYWLTNKNIFNEDFVIYFFKGLSFHWLVSSLLVKVTIVHIDGVKRFLKLRLVNRTYTKKGPFRHFMGNWKGQGQWQGKEMVRVLIF